MSVLLALEHCWRR
uniref:Uncharacterized protein n=1 Tax=Anguilla anguilla TaxID=7936 RepID=A0A0E9TTF6_ANGAN